MRPITAVETNIGVKSRSGELPEDVGSFASFAGGALYFMTALRSGADLLLLGGAIAKLRPALF